MDWYITPWYILKYKQYKNEEQNSISVLWFTVLWKVGKIMARIL